MRLRAFGLCLIGLSNACGARTEPISIQSFSGRAPVQAGTNSVAAGGLASTGGWSTAGGTSSVEVGGGSSTPGSAYRWLAVQQTVNDGVKLSLIGIGTSTITRFDLPQGDAVAHASVDWSVVFNPSGKRFAYVTNSDGMQRFWAVTLTRDAFSTQELRLPD